MRLYQQHYQYLYYINTVHAAIKYLYNLLQVSYF